MFTSILHVTVIVKYFLSRGHLIDHQGILVYHLFNNIDVYILKRYDYN